MFRVLKYIDMIYRERSFSRAAQKLHLAQPSLSLTIKKFEQDIGIQIFDRSATPIRLTDAGEVYIRGIQQILSIENDLEAYIDDYNELRTGKLIVGAAHLFASYLLPGMIAQFQKQYPHVEVRLVEGNLNSLYQMLLEGEIDLLIESNDFDEALFCCMNLREEHILLAVPRSDPANEVLADYRLNAEDICRDKHLEENCPAIALSVFKNHRFLSLEKGHDMRERGRQMCRDAGFEPQIGMELNQLMTIYNLVDQQLGVAFVSDTIVKLSPPGRNVLFYCLQGERAARHINLAYKRSRYVSRAMGAFIQLAETLGGEKAQMHV